MEKKKRKHKKRTSERWIHMAETGWNRGWWSYIYDLINENLILPVKKTNMIWMDWCGRLRAITFLPRTELDSLGSCLIQFIRKLKTNKFFFPTFWQCKKLSFKKRFKKIPLMRNRNETNDWNGFQPQYTRKKHRERGCTLQFSLSP